MARIGSYEVHKSDNDFNKEVLEAIALAKLTKNTRDYIDCLSGGKKIINVKEEKDTEIQEMYIGIKEEAEGSI